MNLDSEYRYRRAGDYSLFLRIRSPIRLNIRANTNTHMDLCHELEQFVVCGWETR